jgi:dCTP deaminase
MAVPMNPPECTKSLLSDKAILYHLAKSSIIIDPFIPKHLSTSSYDVTLGRYYFREQRPILPKADCYNPYDEKMVKQIWGPVQQAEKAADYTKRTGIPLLNIDPNDEIIMIGPGETILGHTIEFIGGRETVTTMMKARSSMGRNFIEVCKCAGWGDIGFINRWTMELSNNSKYYHIPLVVGRRIAQIVFFDSDGPVDARSYTKDGKYQVGNDLEQVKKEWSPESCLPQMYRDIEIRSGSVIDPIFVAKK